MLSDTPFHYQKDSHWPSFPLDTAAMRPSLLYPFTSSLPTHDATKPRLTHTTLSKGPFPPIPPVPPRRAPGASAAAIPQPHGVPNPAIFRAGAAWQAQRLPWAVPGPAPQALHRVMPRREPPTNPTFPNNPDGAAWGAYRNSLTNLQGVVSDDDLDADLQDHIMSTLPQTRAKLSRSWRRPHALETVPIPANPPVPNTVAAGAATSSSNNITAARGVVGHTHSLTVPVAVARRHRFGMYDTDMYMGGYDGVFFDEPQVAGDLLDFADSDPDFSALYMNQVRQQHQQPTESAASRVLPAAPDFDMLSNSEEYLRAEERWGQHRAHEAALHAQQRAPPLPSSGLIWQQQRYQQLQQQQLQQSAQTRVSPQLTPAVLPPSQSGPTIRKVRQSLPRVRAVSQGPEVAQGTAVQELESLPVATVTPDNTATPEHLPAAHISPALCNPAGSVTPSSVFSVVTSLTHAAVNPTAAEPLTATSLATTPTTTATAVHRAPVSARSPRAATQRTDSDEEGHIESPNLLTMHRRDNSEGFSGRLRQLIPNPLSCTAAPSTQPAVAPLSQAASSAGDMRSLRFGLVGSRHASPQAGQELEEQPVTQSKRLPVQQLIQQHQQQQPQVSKFYLAT